MKVVMKGRQRGIFPWATGTLEITLEADSIEEMKVLLKAVKFKFNM